MRKIIITLITVALIANSCNQTPKIPEHFTETTGVTEFYYAPLDTVINVFYHIPEGGDIRRMPILFSIHGTVRNADDYRDYFIKLADSLGFMVFAPQFVNRGLFAGTPGYNLGRMYDENNAVRPREQWTFTIIEHLFDFIVEDLGSRQTQYDMYGHSAGSQFVHRFLYFMPEARVRKAIAANAGWYTLPDFTVELPYGLKDSPATPEMLKKAFAGKMYIALGTEDNNHAASDLRRCENTDKQGIHRFERGHFFWENAQINSAGMPFNWELVIVPGIAHSGRRMAAETIHLLYN